MCWLLDADVSDPIEAPDVFDNSASLGHDTQDVSHNSGLLGHDTDHSEPEKIYLGWEHHGIKSQKGTHHLFQSEILQS